MFSFQELLFIICDHIILHLYAGSPVWIVVMEVACFVV